MAKLVILRETGDVCSCSGCGKDSKALYHVVGQYDFEHGDEDFGMYLCWNCVRPLRKLVDRIRGAPYLVESGGVR